MEVSVKSALSIDALKVKTTFLLSFLHLPFDVTYCVVMGGSPVTWCRRRLTERSSKSDCRASQYTGFRFRRDLLKIFLVISFCAFHKQNFFLFVLHFHVSSNSDCLYKLPFIKWFQLQISTIGVFSLSSSLFSTGCYVSLNVTWPVYTFWKIIKLHDA